MYKPVWSMKGCGLSPAIRASRYMRPFSTSPISNNGIVTNSSQGEAEPSGPSKNDVAFHKSGDCQKAPCTPTQVPSSRRALPLSPVMDPAWIAARQRHQIPKARPGSQPTKLQQQLAKNPYAQALATPMRKCALTDTRLPSFFLQDFQLMSHPTTNEPWFLPRSLTPSKPSVIKTKDDETLNVNEIAQLKDTSTPEQTPTIGPKAYILSRQSLMDSITTKKTKYYNGWQAMVAVRTRKPRFSIDMKKVKWRPDMPKFILKLMRRRLMESLMNTMNAKLGYVKKGQILDGKDEWKDAKTKKQTAALLWLGSPEVEAMEEGNRDIESPKIDQSLEHPAPKSIPGEFATLDVGRKRKRKTPVYNLQMLLGAERVAELRKEHPWIANSTILTLSSRKQTLELQMKLWKLQGYLARHEEYQ